MDDVLYSYTYSCPRCHTLQSYVPAPGEEVRCQMRSVGTKKVCDTPMERVD
jgi:hypothetical protein